MSLKTAPNSQAGIEKQARSVLETACRQDVKLTTAESCTGGALSALLTDVEGMSHAFDRGFVTYSDDAKCDLLLVDRGEIERCGAVSREIAVAIVRQVARHLASAVSALTTTLSNIAACLASRTLRIAKRWRSVSFCNSPITSCVSSIASVTRGP